MSLVITGNSISVSAGPIVTVSNLGVKTNTFRFLNANATGYSYVGVFSNYADAVAMNHPDTSGTTGLAIPLAPTTSAIVTGNFGPQQLSEQANVYVSIITAGSSGQAVIATPLAPGSN
jgi:hypothetical protein